MEWPACSLNLRGICLGLLFLPEWPTQPCWLTWGQINACWKIGYHPHISVWPSWWEAWGWGARLWLCMVLPLDIEDPVFTNAFLHCFLQTSFIQASQEHHTKVSSRVSSLSWPVKIWQVFHECNAQAHLCCSPTTAFSTQTWHNYWQNTMLQ